MVTITQCDNELDVKDWTNQEGDYYDIITFLERWIENTLKYVKHGVLFFFYFYFIVKIKFYWRLKDYTIRSNNPIKRERQNSDSKNDICHDPRPYKKDNKTIQQKANTKFYNNKRTTWRAINARKWNEEEYQNWRSDKQWWTSCFHFR